MMTMAKAQGLTTDFSKRMTMNVIARNIVSTTPTTTHLKSTRSKSRRRRSWAGMTPFVFASTILLMLLQHQCHAWMTIPPSTMPHPTHSFLLHRHGSSSRTTTSPLEWMSPRRRRQQQHPKLTVQQASSSPSNKEDQEDDEENKTNEKDTTTAKPITNILESAIQTVTGNEDYHFGDISKKALSDLTGKDIQTLQEYEFGDITKNLVTKAGKTITGNDNYVFGDITKGMLSDVEHSLEEWTGPSLNELPIQLVQNLLSKMDRPQRHATYVAIIRLLAIALLTWSFVANICTSITVITAWGHTCWKMATTTAAAAASATTTKTTAVAAAAVGSWWNPIYVVRTNGIYRQMFLNSYTWFKLVLDPFWLILQGGGTLFGIWSYQQFVTHIEQSSWSIISSCKFKLQYPIVYRLLALVIAFLSNICIAVFFTVIGMGFGTMIGHWKLQWLLLSSQ